jgi:hypothetical protein
MKKLPQYFAFKKMKTQFIFVNIILLAIFLFSSCADNTTSTFNRDNQTKQRIFAKESTIYRGVEYHILEVDGVEYIASYRGGICPLVKN